MDYANEIWKPCPDFEEKYLISNYGRIKSIGNYNTCKTNGLLNLYKKKSRNGYIQVRLFDNNRVKTVEVHSLVAKAFVPNPYNLPMVNHKDEDKANNYYENLEWCDNKYNIRYSRAKAIDVYTKNGVFVETINVLSDVAEKYNMPTRNVSRCCKMHYNTRSGFTFRYHNEKF